MEQAQTINLMSFRGVGQVNAEVALSHVGAREFRRTLLAKYPDWNGEFHYEYAIFRDDESCVFAARPDETDAKPVTVTYFGSRPEQL